MQSIANEHRWLLDVAHNPAAAEALAATLAEQAFGGRTIALIAMLDDKDIEASIGPLLPFVDNWVAFPADNARAAPVDRLAQTIANLSDKACLEAPDVVQAIAFAEDLCGRDDRILVTGSFYGVGPVLAALGLYSPR
jgi:dihydrofolate synthase/folylpolyglutamate synthase